jgi:predicted dehydrogenase
MKRIGIVGFGAMGHTHFKNFSQINDAKIVAICDIDAVKLTSKKGIETNISSSQNEFDLSGVQIFSNAEKMFKEAELDAVSITLPTCLHKEYTIKALNAGLHVLCEKPMSLCSNDCNEMIEVAEKNRKILQIGHCIRFWPEYAKAKEIIDSKKYGKLKAASFHRLSLVPTWAWDNWMLDDERSGGALVDLHIHDTDFVQYLFGMPKAVLTNGVKGPSGGYDHVVTNYDYDDQKVVTAEGGWIMTNSFGFKMFFEIIFERAVLCYDCKKNPTLTIYPDSGELLNPEIESGNGYFHQCKHFLKVISGHSVPRIITPEESLLSLKLIEAEKCSIESNAKIDL